MSGNIFLKNQTVLMQYLEREFSRTTNIAAYAGAATSKGSDKLVSYDSATGIFTALRPINLTITISALQAGASGILPLSVVGSHRAVSTTTSAGQWTSSTYTGLLDTGQTFSVRNEAGSSGADRTYVTAIGIE